MGTPAAAKQAGLAAADYRHVQSFTEWFVAERGE
jgi:hypothetical protein